MATCFIRVVRVTSGTTTVLQNPQANVKATGGQIQDTPAAGTHTYRLEMRQAGGEAGAGVASASILVLRTKR